MASNARFLSLCIKQLLFSLSGIYLTTWLGAAMQQLTTVGAPPPGVTVCDTCDGSVFQLLTADSWLLTDLAVIWFYRYSICTDPQRTLLPTVPLFLHAQLLLWWCGVSCSTVASLFVVPLPSNGCLFHSLCHNKMNRDTAPILRV
jgi:hypothetical protein